MEYLTGFSDYVLGFVIAILINIWSAFLYVLVLAFAANVGYRLRHVNIYRLSGGSLTIVLLLGLLTGQNIVDSVWLNRLMGACGVIFFIQFFTIVDKFTSLSDGIDSNQMARVERFVGSAFIKTTLRASVDNPFLGWIIRLFVVLFGFIPRSKIVAVWHTRKKSK